MPKRVFSRNLFLLSSFTLASFAAASCHSDPIAPNPVVPVRVTGVTTNVPDENIRYSATIVPYAQVNLAFRSSGYVDRISVRKGADGRTRPLESGDRIVRNEVLATVRQKEYADRVTQAKAQLDQAKVGLDHSQLDYDRTSALYKTGSATKPQFDSAKATNDANVAGVENAKAALAQAEISLSDATLRSPLDGWVLERDIELGTLASPGTQAFVVANTQFVKAVFGVPDTMIPRIKLGDPQVITTPVVSRQFHGRVTSISPSADPRSRVFSVEVTLPNKDNVLKSGMIATLAVAPRTPLPAAIYIPLGAVARSSKTSGGFAVFVVTDSNGKSYAHERDVKIGDTVGNTIAVTEGLRTGEKIVSVGVGQFKDGDQVQVIP